ncbi:hypothetical protein GW756_02390 [bacterium]|nr:hypothetical protein [bacterium]NCQ55642.1 hypothetical protein [Candidatus Parcubacteria bacterium]NCS67467.1 hypothetical protein [Candidatus Peregrinibacteria bacterium]NCS96193.1 hypothetical protein [bacterium]
MKLDIQTKTEKTNFLGLLLFMNFVLGGILFFLLMIQFFYAPKYYAVTWTFMLLISLVVSYFNLRYFRAQFKVKHLWQWLKKHQ